MSCFYCEKDERLLALMTPLTELQWSDVYLFNDQKHKGRCVVALKIMIFVIYVNMTNVIKV